jgi:hypothetical protein
MSISFQSTIRSCKIQAGEAARIESDRFLNPVNMVCPMWTGQNGKGQTVCRDSVNTQVAGCNSATERVNVENEHRPQYTTELNFNIEGLQGDTYNQSHYNDAGLATSYIDNINNVTGNFGHQFRSSNIGSCGMYSFEKNMADVSERQRKQYYDQSNY